MSQRIVLTGGIGSGKSTAAAWLQARGACLIDYDLISHQLTAAGAKAMPAIANRFGEEVLTSDGSLDRQRMRQIVFTDPHARAALENILHPLIRQHAVQADANADGQVSLIVHDIPLFTEGGGRRDFLPDLRVLLIDCPEPKQIEHCLARGNLTQTQIEAIIGSQASRAARLALADDVIVNAGTIDQFHAKLAQLWKIWGLSASQTA